MTTWTEAESADGPALAAFLDSRVRVHSNAERYVRTWREGARPSYFEVDRVLTRCGLHANDVPDHLWSTEPACQPTEWRVPHRRTDAA